MHPPKLRDEWVKQHWYDEEEMQSEPAEGESIMERQLNDRIKEGLGAWS